LPLKRALTAVPPGALAAIVKANGFLLSWKELYFWRAKRPAVSREEIEALEG